MSARDLLAGADGAADDARAAFAQSWLDDACAAAVAPVTAERDAALVRADAAEARIVALQGDLVGKDEIIAQLHARIAELEAGEPEPVRFLFGGATGGNGDPSLIEAKAGVPLGVRRTYFDYGKITQAVTMCRDDIAAGRVPYVSFKVNTSWTNAAAGAVDAVTADLAARLAALGGRIMVSIHHEPEGDEPDIQKWVQMQRRLAPFFTAHANLEFGITLTGYHQREDSPATYSLDTLWPGDDAGIDFIGFDAYQLFGSQAGSVKSWTDLPKHIEWYGRWCRAHNVAWGLAETGISDDAFTSQFASRAETWIADTVEAIRANGGTHFCYFNSGLNSTTTWVITPGKTSKEAQYLAALRESRED